MPGVLAAIISMVYLCTLEGKGFAADYFYITDPANSKVPGTYND